MVEGATPGGAERSHRKTQNGRLLEKTPTRTLELQASNSLYKPFSHTIAICFPNKPRKWARIVLLSLFLFCR